MPFDRHVAKTFAASFFIHWDLELKCRKSKHNIHLVIFPLAIHFFMHMSPMYWINGIQYFAHHKIIHQKSVAYIFSQATSGGGGWPMSVWLTPDLRPIVGGTYFPPDERYFGRPGFKSILNSIAKKVCLFPMFS